jgi:hypothetical protein
MVFQPGIKKLHNFNTEIIFSAAAKTTEIYATPVAQNNTTKKSAPLYKKQPVTR